MWLVAATVGGMEALLVLARASTRKQWPEPTTLVFHWIRARPLNFLEPRFGLGRQAASVGSGRFAMLLGIYRAKTINIALYQNLPLPTAYLPSQPLESNKIDHRTLRYWPPRQYFIIRGCFFDTHPYRSKSFLSIRPCMPSKNRFR